MNNKKVALIVVAVFFGIGILCMGLISLNSAISKRQQEAIKADTEDVSELQDTQDMRDTEEWQDKLFLSAVRKLCDESAVSFRADEGFSFDFHELDFGGENGINPVSIFSSEGLAQQYAKAPDLRKGKVICGEFFSGEDHVRLYMNTPGEEPCYYPADEYPLSDGRVPHERYADSTEECDYLLLTAAQETRRDEEYYYGGIDRVSTATLALVIDARSETIVYADTVYVDIPASSTYNPIGRARHALAKMRLISFMAEDELPPAEEEIAAILEKCTNPAAYSVCDINRDGSYELLVMEEQEGNLTWSVFGKTYSNEYDLLKTEDSIQAYEDDEIFCVTQNGMVHVYILSSDPDVSGRDLVFDGSMVETEYYISASLAPDSAAAECTTIIRINK